MNAQEAIAASDTLSLAKHQHAAIGSVRSVAAQALVNLCLPISSGIVLAVAFMPAPLDVLAWIALVPFGIAIGRATASVESYLGAYLGGLIFSLHGQVWMQSRLTGAGPFDSNTADWLLQGSLLAVGWPLTLYIARRLMHGARLPLIWSLPVVWVAGEFVRQELGWLLVWSPFPWLQLGITQADHLQLAQIADLGGVWAITLLVAVINGAIVDGLCTRSVRPIAIGAVLLIAAWGYGELRLRETSTVAGPSVALVPHHGELGAWDAGAVDLLLWSETAARGELSSASQAAFEARARQSGSILIVGVIRPEGNMRFNSAACFDPQSGYQGAYDKCYLVPWAEFRPWTAPQAGPARGGFSRGARYPVFKAGKHTYGAVICYDICFASLFRKYSHLPDFFVCLARETTDPTGFIARILLKMARLRAIETRRPIVRNVEGGFSGIVTSTGQFVSAPPMPWTGPASVGRIPVDERSTLAALAGDWIPIACSVVTIAALAMAWGFGPSSRRAMQEPSKSTAGLGQTVAPEHKQES